MIITYNLWRKSSWWGYQEMVIEDIKIGSLDSSKILETAVEPFYGWYRLKRELVSIKKVLIIIPDLLSTYKSTRVGVTHCTSQMYSLENTR
jgi:hypothetical protein